MKKIIIILFFLVCSVAAIALMGPRYVPENVHEPSLHYSDGLARVYNGLKSGYVNTAGKQVIDCKFDYADGFHSGHALVAINDKYGYINKSGTIVIPCVYDYAQEFADSNSPYWSISVFNARGYNYDYLPNHIIRHLDHSLLLVRKGEKLGFINVAGKEVVPCRYDDAANFCDGLAYVGIHDTGNTYKYGYINKKGKIVIPLVYDGAGVFTEGLAVVKKDSLYGYINKNGKIVFDIKYDGAFPFYNGYAQVMKGKLWGVIDKKGKEVMPFLASEPIIFKGQIGQVIHSDTVGFVNKQYKFVLPLQYENTYLSSGDGSMIPIQQNGEIGYLDTNGKIMIPCTINVSNKHSYLIGNCFFNGFSAVEKGDKSQLINKHGKILGDMYDVINMYTDGGLILVYNSKKYGYIDTAGNEVIKCIYDKAFSFKDSEAVVVLDNKWGIINKKGKMVIPCQYDEIMNFYGRRASVKKGNLFGFIDRRNNLVIPYKYSSTYDFETGMAWVSIGGKYSYIDTMGKEIIFK